MGQFESALNESAFNEPTFNVSTLSESVLRESVLGDIFRDIFAGFFGIFLRDRDFQPEKVNRATDLSTDLSTDLFPKQNQFVVF